MRLFDRTSGVSLVDAVAASCAVPGVWPPVTIGDARYIDGGIRTFTNLDLAAGYTRVLVIAPMPDPALEKDAASIAEHGRIEVITPDDAARAAFGTDPLVPTTRTPSGHAGFAQGRAAAQAVAGLWNGA
jgi:NTE family protein